MAKGWRGRWLTQWGDDCNAGEQAPVMKHAVVIGAGMAGLTAASAQAAHVDQVTVLERDRPADTAAQHPGTPQALHVHGLLAGGLHFSAWARGAGRNAHLGGRPRCDGDDHDVPGQGAMI